ncbi:hypothetical protein EMPS_04451 [Entomortierella parvispora]|uniref:Uncharacterized protein n=1 Tax=Entomortierella parvispora TaxID=205924 RepID=A0A9P3H8L1_9FUNG|nr:hypothetical protein EMPS_04451 [Entomortierella parvispora]
MSIILPQQTIPLRNPYSVLLEQESEPTHDHQDYYSHHSNSEGQDDGHDQMSVGSWSVIASTTGSDNEDEDEEESDEILLNEDSIAASLTVSNLGDGFTDISKTLTATSINSASLAGRSDAWAIKVSKKKPIPRKEGSPSTHTSTSASRYEEDDELSLEEQYMQMTEHELSKSAKAVKLKNIRLATAYDKELFRVLNVPDRKALPTRAIVTERSKTRGARCLGTD